MIAVGSIAGYVLSRTIGLPSSGIEPWGPPIGYVSLILEILFVVLAARLSEFQNFLKQAVQWKSISI